jgi:pantoate--beta-alanine ligase
VLYRALAAAQAAHAEGERDADVLRSVMSSTLAGEPLAREEYVSVADRETLDELEEVPLGALLSLAVRIGKTRLIDNIVLL